MAAVAGAVLALSGLAWAAAPTLGTAEVGAQETTRFEHTGEEQTYTVPEGVCEVTVDVAGAEGGEGYNVGYAGLAISADGTPSVGSPGLGGRVQATLAVTPGEVLSVFVGGAGGDGTVLVGPPDGSADATGGAGGWNGGTNGGAAAIDAEIQPDDTYYAGVATAGGGGGGASDIRRGGTAESDRIVVAGGGGGSGSNGMSATTPSSLNQRDGGSGGDANGGDGSDGEAATGSGGAGGAQGGATGSPGGFATSQNDDDFLSVVASAGGGGGGGYAGGDGGSAADNLNGVLSGAAGGGGAGSAFGPFGATITDAFQDGDGYVEITPAEPGVGCAPVLQVAKVVSGTAPAGFTVRVDCVAATPAEVDAAATDTVVLDDLPYLADGSPDAAGAPAGWTVNGGGVWEYTSDDLTGATCTATETATAGATSVSYSCACSTKLAEVPSGSGCPGASSGPSASPQSVVLSDPGQTGVLTVTNTFPAAAAEVSPNFTG